MNMQIVGIHWIALICKKNEIIYFDSFGVVYIPNEIKEILKYRNIIKMNQDLMGFFQEIIYLKAISWKK